MSNFCLSWPLWHSRGCTHNNNDMGVHWYSSCVKSVYTLHVQCLYLHMYTVRHPCLCCSTFTHWRSDGMERNMEMDTPAGCENCWCPDVRDSLPSHWCPEHLRRGTPRHPTSQSVLSGSGGRGCCNPLCSLSRRVAGRRSYHQSRHASSQSSQPGASMSSLQLPHSCRRSSACGWSFPSSQREALWGSILEQEMMDKQRIT